MSGESVEEVRLGLLAAELHRAVHERARELDPAGEWDDGGLGLAAEEIAAARAVGRVVDGLTQALTAVGPVVPVGGAEAAVEPPPGPAVAVPDVGPVDPLTLPRNQRGAFADGIGWRRRPGGVRSGPVAGPLGLCRGRGLGWRVMGG